VQLSNRCLKLRADSFIPDGSEAKSFEEKFLQDEDLCRQG